MVLIPKFLILICLPIQRHRKRRVFPRALRVHHVPPLSRVAVFADKAVKLRRLEQNCFPGEPDALQPPLAHPPHDGGAVHVTQMLGGLAKSQQARTGRGARVNLRFRFGGGRPADRSAPGIRFDGSFHGGKVKFAKTLEVFDRHRIAL